MTQRHSSRNETNSEAGISDYPRTVYLHVTRLCNLHCSYCYLDAGRYIRHELTSHEVKRILSEVIPFQPDKVVFTGGEPLMRQDIIELARFFRSLDSIHHIRLCLDTNGILVNATMAPALGEVFDEIRVSMDGFEETNDALRGRGCFKAGLRAIREMRCTGVVPSLAITATSINVSDIAPFISYMSYEWGIRTVRINSLKPMGRAMTRPELLLREGQLGFSGYSPTCGSSMSPCNGDASCVGRSISINPQGLVFPCHWLSHKDYYIGNARVERVSLLYERLFQVRKQILAKANPS